MDKIMNKYDMLDAAMIKLIKNHNFFANLLMNMTKNFTLDVPTVGVNVTKNVNLYINPYFWNNLTTDEQVGILIHECMHVLNNHFDRFKDIHPDLFDTSKEKTAGDKVVKNIVDGGKFRSLNMAADFAINEYIPSLPKKFTAFDKEGNPLLGEDGKPLEMRPCLVADQQDWERYKHMEYYHQKMKENPQGGNGGKGRGKGDSNSDGYGYTIDDHTIWEEGNQDQEYVLEKIKNTVNKAVEASGGIGAGDIPGDVKVLIDKLNYQAKDWRGELQRFVSKSSEILRESSRKNRNRRYGVLYPGFKNDPKLTIAVIIDTSGSICEDALGQFQAEINRIHQAGAEIHIIECDSEVKQVYKFDPRKKFEVKGRGGTDFAPGFEAASKLDPDAAIYFTDGEDYGPTVKKPPYPVLWALLPDCKVRYPWGYKTTVTIKKKV